MKKILILVFILLTIGARAQQQDTVFKITFEEFENWMKSFSPLGYPFTETGRNGPEYVATFLKKEELKMIGITLSPMSTFDGYKKYKGIEPYKFKGHKVVFYGMQGMWNLNAESEELNGCLQITTVYLDAKKEDLEKILEQSGFLDKKWK